MQRCPAEDDRFFEHCKEGREHYRLKINFECLGEEAARYLRRSIGMTDEDTSPYVNRWLTKEHATVVSGHQCIDAQLDRACWYCIPEKRASANKSSPEN